MEIVGIINSATIGFIIKIANSGVILEMECHQVGDREGEIR